MTSFNWGLFIWAINAGRVMEGSLGYYISPLVNVLLGWLFLGERLRKLQVGAVGLALLGVLNLAVGVGQVPWVALVLAGTFSLYGLVRKLAPVESLTGLAVETALATPLALGLLVWGNWGLQLALAVLLYGEAFGSRHAVTFACIWTAVVLYTFDGLWGTRSLSPTPAGQGT